MKTNFFDTNIFIYYFQNTSEVVKLFKQIKNNNEIILFSFVSKIEMLGVPGISEEELIKIENFLNEFICIDYNKEIEKLTIDIRKQKSVKIPDAIIAASAIFTNSVLVTRNTKDFQNIPALKLLNPFE